MSDNAVLKFQKRAPAVLKDKPIDMLMVYPSPCLDSPFNLTALSILYPGAMFESQGMKVSYLDMRYDSEQQLEDMIKDSAQIGVSAFTGYQCGRAADIMVRAKQINPKIVTHVGGHHARMCPEDVRAESFVDVVWPERSYGEDLFPFSKAAQRIWKLAPDMQMVTSTGCPFACLRGDTLVNTIYGNISIKELAETRTTVPVYTYNPKSKEAFVADAINIRKTGKDRELVRVHFDDGTHIDCTPDHRFLAFWWGNQTVPAWEKEKEAQHLVPGEHVRAFRTEIAGQGRAYITWARRAKKLRSRMVVEYRMGRELLSKEHIHHIDHDQLNDHPDNLQFFPSQREHVKAHPEVAQRMRDHNPAKNMTPEWRERIGNGIRGTKRTLEQRKHYRESKLGAKNPNYKGGTSTGRTRIKEVNHVVISVEKLAVREDVYCMEVPATGWFYANNVLVHNCSFCALRSAWNPRDLDALEKQIDAVHDLTGFTEVSFSDPNLGHGKYRGPDGKAVRLDRVERMRGIGKLLRKHSIRWDGNLRCDLIDPAMVEAMVWSGCYSIEFGAESGNDEFLRKTIKKGHGVDDIRQANKLMTGTGISVMNSFVRGIPRETHRQWLDTMDFIDEIMSIAPEARASIYRFTPYPGGPAYDDAVAGVGIEKFDPPKTMAQWGSMKLMVDATYWVAGLNFRMDNTTKNFPGDDWKLIEPYVLEARKLWAERRPEDFAHAEEVERLITWQVRKHNAQSVQVAA